MILIETRTASVVATGYCEIFLLTLEGFNRIKAEYPKFKEVMKQMAAENTERKIMVIEEGIIL